MRFLSRLIICALALAVTPLGGHAAPPADNSSFHLCYFSLNNENEFKEMDRFLVKLNKVSPRKITIKEYVSSEPGMDVKASFQAMIDSGERCDGLVISGHHTGSFGGPRATGSLDVSFMENLSCDPKYEGWFRNIQSLWLQGCRTLGVGKIEATLEDDESYSADFHTARVGNVLDEDGLTQSFSDLNVEFSGTLDQDNPLSSRYLRVFPRSSVFGWTKTAPGKKTRSEFSIPYHIAHIAKLNDDRKRLFEDPCQSDHLSDQTALCYANVLTGLLNAPEKSNSSQKNCKNLAVQGWINHGNPKKGEYGFDNQDINASDPLEKLMDPDLLQAHEDDCKLKSVSKPADVLGALNSVLRNQKSIGYSFNSVWEMMQRLKGAESPQDLALLDQVQKKLKSNAELQIFLSRKLASPQLGLLRKMDYYAFYRDLTGQKVPQVEKLIFSTATKQLAASPAESYDLRDYQQTLMQSLSKNGLLNLERIQTLVNDVRKPELILSEVASAIRDDFTLIPEAEKVLEFIIRHPKADSHALVAAAQTIEGSEADIPNVSELLMTLIKSPGTDSTSLKHAAYAIHGQGGTLQHSAQLLDAIVQSPRADEYALSEVAMVISESQMKSPIPNGSKLIGKIIQSPRVNGDVLDAIAQLLMQTDSKLSSQEKLQYAEAILASPLTEPSTQQNLRNRFRLQK